MDELYLWLPVVIVVGILLSILVSYRNYQKIKKNKVLDDESTDLPDVLVLKRPFALLSEKRLRNLKLVMILAFLIIFSMFFGILVLSVNSVNKFTEKLYKVVSDDTQLMFGFVVMLVFTVLYPLYVGKAAANEQLTLTRDGINYQPTGFLLFDLFMPAWTMKWQDVATVNMERIGVQGRLCLTDMNGKKRHLLINQWREKNTANEQQPVMFREIWEARELQLNPLAIFEKPLVRYIQKYTDLKMDESKLDLNFDLTSHTKTRNQLWFIAGLGSYALVDALLNMETYLVTPPLWWFVIFGFIASIFAFLKISDKEIPISNAIGVGIIFGLTFGIALYPGLLRINQVTDPYGLRSYEYHMEHDGIFRNDDASMPEISMSPDKYWRSIETGQSYTFKLRKGGLGFYQIDMDDVYAKMRKWYCEQEKDNPTDIKIGCD